MNSVFRIVAKALIFLRLISVDIVLGVICSSYYASVVFNAKLSVYYFITLASMVWVIYIADHIFDGLRTLSKPGSGNYRFHYKNRFALLTVGLIITLLSAYLVLFHFEKRLLIFGISTFVLVVVYLILNFVFQYKNKFFPKELIIAVLYTWGIFGGSLAKNGKMELFQFLIIMNFLLLVFCNVLLFSYFDSRENIVDSLNSITAKIGPKKTRNLIIALLTVALILSVYTGIVFSIGNETIILVFVGLILLFIVFFPSLFKNDIYFGLIADSVFLIPVIIYWIH